MAWGSAPLSTFSDGYSFSAPLPLTRVKATEEKQRGNEPGAAPRYGPFKEVL